MTRTRRPEPEECGDVDRSMGSPSASTSHPRVELRNARWRRRLDARLLLNACYRRRQRQPNGDGGSLPPLAHDVDPPGVLLDDALHQRQAETDAVGLRAEERLEQLVTVLGADAHSVVGDAELQLPVGYRRRDCNFSRVAVGIMAQDDSLL